MSYAMSLSLQSALYQHLSADAALSALVGPAIYDALPPGTLPPLYVVLGAEDVRDSSDKTGAGAVHRLKVSVVTEEAGFAEAKTVAAAISDALVDAPLTMTRGHLVSLNFLRARAIRVDGGTQRRIDLIFQARVADTAP